MSHLKKIASSTLAALMLGALCAGASLADQAGEKNAATAQAKASADNALLRVNGKPITRQEMERSVKILLAQSRGSQLPPDALKKAQDAVLEQLTNSELLYQAAQQLELKDLEQQVERQLAQNRAKFATEAEYQAALDGLEMTGKDMEEFTRRDVAINNMIEKQFGEKMQVAESEAKKFYDDNRARLFEKGESLRASHILIGTEQGAAPQERTEAKAKADALLVRAKAGEDFAKLAKDLSTCPSKAKGGDLGQFARGDMVPSFEKAAYALKPGELSEVVETQFGYHIIKLTERIAAKQEKYQEVKEKIVEYLKREKVRGQLPAFIKELRDKAKIEKV